MLSPSSADVSRGLAPFQAVLQAPTLEAALRRRESAVLAAERFSDVTMLGVVLDVSGLIEAGAAASVRGHRATSATPTPLHVGGRPGSRFGNVTAQAADLCIDGGKNGERVTRTKCLCNQLDNTLINWPSKTDLQGGLSEVAQVEPEAGEQVSQFGRSNHTKGELLLADS